MPTENSEVTQYLRILDTTLRDGDQAAGFAFSPEQKIRLAALIDGCGVDCIEAGFPCSSPAEYSVCKDIVQADLRADIAVMSRCLKDDIVKSAEVFSEINNARRAVMHLTIPVSDIQMRVKLHKTGAEILHVLDESVRLAGKLIGKVEIGFEDATRADRGFLSACCRTAAAAGAFAVNIADTTGSILPEELPELIRFLIREIPSFSDRRVLLSVHCHNDCGLALANTLAAVKAGAMQAEVTAAGLGERCGNTPLEELAYVLSTHGDFYQVMTGLRKEHFAELYRTLFAYCGTDFSPLKPVTGWNSDSHASGLHQQGIRADPSSYIANPVESYGMVHRRYVLNSHSGKNGLLAVINNLTNGAVALSEKDAELLLTEIKSLPENEVGVTALCDLLYKHKFISRKPLTEGSVKTAYENGVYQVEVSSNQCRAEGTGDTLESALMVAVNTLFSLDVRFVTVSLSMYWADGIENGRTRVYAELYSGKSKKTYAVSACGKNKETALFCCLLDVVNAEQLFCSILQNQ
ncbi:MAG TPA: hypothetical protein DCL73_11630 [Treponema sp.]|nr:hypothetical protein [Treponema sp.]